MSDDTKTLWVGNLSDHVTEDLLYELFLQAGPLKQVFIPRDKNGRSKKFAFVTFSHDVSVPYALHLYRGTVLYHKTLMLKPRSRMVDLPPPIRCTTIDPSFTLSQEVKAQFDNMTENVNFENREHNLSVASLQGNWSHRHHPYMDERRHNDRGDHRNNRDNRNRHDRSKPDHKRDNWRHGGYRNNKGRY